MGVTARGGDPVARAIRRQGVLILDGGLATRLEARGGDLDDPLWSARLLPEGEEGGDEIRAVHREYLDAGADCIVTASYQATIQGFGARGIAAARAEELIRRSVTLAVEARDAFWRVEANRAGRLEPLVAASVGPYGAYLADGGEYRGDYDAGVAELIRFHRARWRVLAESGADLLACETIPSRDEALALLALLDETPERGAWFSFSCRDGERISDGTPLAEIAGEAVGHPGLLAVGVNCTSPEHVPSLLGRLRTVTDVPLVAYPNSGETYDAVSKRWTGERVADFGAAARAWVAAGASVVGGCCRTGPRDIATIRRAVLAAG